MIKNMGTIDRAIRALFAIVVAVLYFTNVISDTVALILGILAIVFLAYAWLGPYMPNVLAHRGFLWKYIIEYQAYGLEGLYSSAVGVSSRPWSATQAA